MAVLTMVFAFSPLQAIGLFAALTIASTYLGRRSSPSWRGTMIATSMTPPAG